jgi:hypothetical protein
MPEPDRNDAGGQLPRSTSPDLGALGLRGVADSPRLTSGDALLGGGGDVDSGSGREVDTLSPQIRVSRAPRGARGHPPTRAWDLLSLDLRDWQRGL